MSRQPGKPDPKKRVPSRPARADFLVGLGASAGGLEALTQFFDCVPAASHLTFVVVQHLEPRHPSLLVELLAKHTAMQVVEATDRQRPRPDHVYVIPPGALLTVEKGILRVALRKGQTAGAPIDAFFRSLADDRGERAIGIVFSGAGHDGTAGLRAIREHGGLTLAQSPETAQHDSMPLGAIESGAVDHVLIVAKMPQTLLDHVSFVTHVPKKGATKADVELARSLPAICSLIHQHTGHDFGRYKEGTLLRRIRRRMQVHRLDSGDEYVRLLEKTKGESQLLLKDLLIGVTQFFRDPEAFQALAQQVVPRIVQGKSAAEAPIRIWVPGCTSGEEAYSIAILLCEHLERRQQRNSVQLFATDLDAEMLERARRGRYAKEICEQVSEERLRRFFVRDGRTYQAVKELREMCIFSEQSLIRDPPFSQLDLISCRNVLIYLGADLQKRLVPLFHYALRPGGFLFLGPSEGISGHAGLFETVDKRSRIFRRKETVTRPIVEFPLVGRAPPRLAVAPLPRTAPAHVPPTARDNIGAAFERILKDEYTFPSAVITGNGDALFIAGPISRYLLLSAGPTTMPNLFEAFRGKLSRALRAAVRSVKASGRKVVRDALPVEVEDLTRTVRLVVRPMPAGELEADLFLVVIQEGAKALETTAPEGKDLEASQPLEQLEQELRTTRAELRTTVEELESANEELKSSNEELVSTNEELQSANEEMQTSKEELQSLNEELETVNTELRQKVDELASANSDLQNLFAATEIATIFLDDSLAVEKFTPAATSLFHLIDTDIGRPLSDLTPRFAGQDLMSDAEEVLRLGTPIERQIRAAEGAWFVLRVLPYRTLANVIAGVLITFVDISEIKRAEAATRQQAELVQLSHDAIFVRRFDGLIETWNRGAQELYGYSHAEAVGNTSHELLCTVFPTSLAEIESKLRGGGCWAGELQHRTKDGHLLTVLSNMQFARGEDGVERILEANRDITERKVAEHKLAYLASFPGRNPTPIAEADLEGHVRYANPAATNLWPDLLTRGATHPWLADWQAVARQARERTLDHASTRTVIVGERTYQQALFFLADEATVRTYGVDITDRVRAEQELRQSEQRFVKAFQAGPAPIGIVDTETHRLVEVNDAWVATYGFGRQEALGHTSRELGIVASDDERQRLLDKARNPDAAVAPEIRLLAKNGRRLDVIVRTAAIELGGRACLMSVSLDITERKRAAEALHEANALLREADQNKNEFLAVLSHELRNPLSPIRNSLYVLEHAVPGGDQAKHAQEIIARQTNQLARLVDDLLDVTRVSRNKFRLQRRRLDLNELVQRTVDDHRSIFERNGVQLDLELATARLPVDGDEARLAQIIGNLLQNAAKFTSAGGKVFVATALTASGRRASLHVVDNGEGIEPAVLRRLFQPFTQAEMTLDRSQGGLGLGLALVKGLVEMHGGEVCAHSDGPGKGAQFVIEIPLATTSVAETSVATAAATPRGRRVLIIEDNVDAADSLREALEFGAHLVEVAYDGPSGLAKAKEFNPEIVLCDIGLPGMDGFEVARAFRRDAAFEGIALVALSGYALPDDLARAREAGFVRHLAKPASLETLDQVLAELSDRRA